MHRGLKMPLYSYLCYTLTLGWIHQKWIHKKIQELTFLHYIGSYRLVWYCACKIEKGVKFTVI